MSYTRFAIYFVPPQGPLADFGATWLGWDVYAGRQVPQFAVPGLHQATAAARKYGFHGTLKPPFRLATGTTLNDLRAAVADLAAHTAPARCDGLALTALGRFLALTPLGDAAGLGQIAGTCVTTLDRFRAPLTEQELAKRRASPLSPRQEALLQQYGYPHVLDAFRFHLTLTGRLPKADLDGWRSVVTTHLPRLPTPFEMTRIALVGERADGCFELIQDYALTG